jgi:hypothetical protein
MIQGICFNKASPNSKKEDTKKGEVEFHFVFFSLAAIKL